METLDEQLERAHAQLAEAGQKLAAADAEAAALREVFGLRPIKEFDMWLEKMGFSENGKLTAKAGDASVFLKR